MGKQRGKNWARRHVHPDEPLEEYNGLIDYSQLPPDERPAYIERKKRQAAQQKKEGARMAPYEQFLQSLKDLGGEDEKQD